VTLRRGLLLCAAFAVVALAGLLAAAAQPIVRRTFSLDAPNAIWLAVLRPTSQVCEGPIPANEPTRSVAIWGAAGPTHRASLTVDVRNAATNRILASAPLAAAPVETELTARLRHPVPGGQPLRICLTQDTGTFSLYGYGALNPHVVMTGKLIGPQPTGGRGEEFSLVLFGNRSQSLLDSLGLAFSRAALWRPSWVGSWTFWVLAVALLAAFGLGVASVAAAAADDDGRGRGVSDAEDNPPPTSEQTDEPSSPSVAVR
jgi:hypothetical protein